MTKREKTYLKVTADVLKVPASKLHVAETRDGLAVYVYAALGAIPTERVNTLCAELNRRFWHWSVWQCAFIRGQATGRPVIFSAERPG